MAALLAHLDLMPLLYGVIIFMGLTSLWSKLIHGRFLALIIEISVFTLVFSLHGGTKTGGFAAAIAALLAGIIFPRMIRR
jgi:hypothetical protein